MLMEYLSFVSLMFLSAMKCIMEAIQRNMKIIITTLFSHKQTPMGSNEKRHSGEQWLFQIHLTSLLYYHWLIKLHRSVCIQDASATGKGTACYTTVPVQIFIFLITLLT